MGQVISLPFKLIKLTRIYVSGFLHYLCGKGRSAPYDTASFPALAPRDQDSKNDLTFKQNARVHLFSLASNFYLYNLPHYRKPTYREDLCDNLRNVAIPGTGIPLSWVASTRLIALPFLLTCYPSISLVASLHHWICTGSSISEEYAKRLLAPDDWFNYWRMNCTLVGLHSLLNDMPADYEAENKWTFLSQGEKLGVPVSPFLKTPGIVVKHKNEEGGMGIYFYKNAVSGGDWIIQERIENSDFVSAMLPEGAPLSTFRVITSSRAAADMKPRRSAVESLSCVFRAGRQGAATDHDSILFDMNIKTGEVLRGTINANWYRLWDVLRCPWRSKAYFTHHPDGDIPVTGSVVPDIRSVLDLVEESHHKLCPTVPLAGWDVVLSSDPKRPVCLLEVNLSCNFFGSKSFDKKGYLDFVEDMFASAQNQRLTADR